MLRYTTFWLLLNSFFKTPKCVSKNIKWSYTHAFGVSITHICMLIDMCFKTPTCLSRNLKWSCVGPHTRYVWSVMREAWCVFTEIIENRKTDSTCMLCVMRDAYSFWARVFTALGAVNTHHASLLWRHFLNAPAYPARSLHVIQGQPPRT